MGRVASSRRVRRVFCPTAKCAQKKPGARSKSPCAQPALVGSNHALCIPEKSWREMQGNDHGWALWQRHKAASARKGNEYSKAGLGHIKKPQTDGAGTRITVRCIEPPKLREFGGQDVQGEARRRKIRRVDQATKRLSSTKNNRKEGRRNGKRSGETGRHGA